MSDRIAARAAHLLASLGALPGQWGERMVGVYLAGWGSTALLSPELFDARPTFATLAAGADEWVYGVVFVLIGGWQVAASLIRDDEDAHARRRLWAGLPSLAALVGLAVAFAHTGTWTGVYNYGFIAACDAVLVARLWFLSYARHVRGIDVRAVVGFEVRAGTPSRRTAGSVR